VLVLLGPPFEGTENEYKELSKVTGLVAYDLRTRLRPGLWGVVRALADTAQAETLAERIRQLGLTALAVDPIVAQDEQRSVATLRGLELQAEQMTLRFFERQMSIAYRSLLTIVRGEVRLGHAPAARTAPSSSTFRAVVPTAAEIKVTTQEFDAFAAADLHFFTVPWLARIDARTFDFGSVVPGAKSHADALEQLVALLAERGAVRIDRGHRTSSVASYTEPRGFGRSPTPPPNVAERPKPGDPRFDGYSRLIAEAERSWSRLSGSRS
jgi:hypothetical protein